jgi:hypothetical protein
VKTLKSENVAKQYCNELEYEFQSAHDVQTCSLNELWYDTEESTKKVAVITVDDVQKQANKEWFVCHG